MGTPCNCISNALASYNGMDGDGPILIHQTLPDPAAERPAALLPDIELQNDIMGNGNDHAPDDVLSAE